MTRKNGGDGEEPRELGRVPEKDPGTRPKDAGRKMEDDWAASGTEDPAFFIKPSDGE